MKNEGHVIGWYRSYIRREPPLYLPVKRGPKGGLWIEGEKGNRRYIYVQRYFRLTLEGRITVELPKSAMVDKDEAKRQEEEGETRIGA